MAFGSGENMRCSGEPDRSHRYIDGLANQKANGGSCHGSIEPSVLT
ncbi:hypothetical protein SBC1_70350 (plasmid) [Caballeronia sp. SBC1]|nr:hypothetical protein SBC2_70090 [Caballeronia sp. SBC2]QIN66988.1 hypothetical protein SBC1_70350 [Caballeronia sp. SBC1]